MSSYRRISASLNPLIFSRGIVRGLPRFFGLFLSDIESLSDPYGNSDCEGYVFIKSDYSVNPLLVTYWDGLE